MITFPNAKVNLGLNITSRRPDGYHNIATVFYPIGLTDSLEIVPAKPGHGTSLTNHGRVVDCPPEQNLVMRAWALLKQQFPQLPAVEMHLLKHIPFGAGLGGGSSDASAALLMLNDMFALGLDRDRLCALAARLGADCPFFVLNHPVMATGIGDVFSPVTVDLQGWTMLLVKPDVHVPTAQAYALVRPREPQEPIPAILQRPVEQWQGTLANDFEPSVFAAHPQLAAVKQALLDAGAAYASMSGSGSSIFGLFGSANLAEQAALGFAGTDHYVISL